MRPGALLSGEPWQPPAATIPACIAWWAATTPDAPALLGIGGETVSYRRLQERIDRFGHDLAAVGIGRGDRVMLALPSGVAGAIATLAAMRSAVAIPVNPAASGPEAAEMLGLVEPRLLIVARGAETAFHAAAAPARVSICEIDATVSKGEKSHASEAPAPANPDPAGDDLALILLTSGTTDRPRRVPATHAGLLAMATTLANGRPTGPRDRNLNSAPLSFVMGLSSMAISLITGGSAIVTSPDEIVAHPGTVRALAPTWMSLVPSLLDAVLEAAEENPAFARWPLRFVRVSGALASPELIARGQALWDAPVINGYGTTETHGIIASEEGPGVVARKPGSVGLARPGMEIAIAAADGAHLPPEVTGEIVVRGRHVFAGYLDAPEASSAAFHPGGWYRTGDLGYLDGEGYLFVTGRLREMINRGGEKIAPHEVDMVLRAHPAVGDAATFALPSPRLGEEVAAAVVVRAGASLRERALRGWVADRLSLHKVPRKIWFVDEIPRTGSGKIQRTLLATQFQNRGPD